MINKLLCFMWGHQFEDILFSTYSYIVQGWTIRRTTYEGITKKEVCKHCGKTK